MDVILDSNQYLSDPLMTGHGFANLFDYLRRTGSQLVVPRVVLDEVIARYPERLRGTVEKAKVAVDALNKISAQSTKLVSLPRIADEVEALKARIEKPGKRINVAINADYRSIDLSEAVRRQISRTPPASKGGEQFRDVVVWLSVLAHCHSTKPSETVAFVTNDSGFWTDNSYQLSLVEEEIQNSSIPVKIYGTIDSFIKKQAPSPKTASKEWAEKYISSDRIEEIAAVQSYNFLAQSFGRPTRMISGAAQQTVFKTGAIYKVGEDSQFAEVNYRFIVSLEVEIENRALLWTDPLYTPQEMMYRNLYGYPPWHIATPLSRGGKETGNSVLLSAPFVLSVPQTETLVRRFTVQGTVTVSLRVVKGEASTTEFERFKSIDFTEDAAD